MKRYLSFLIFLLLFLDLSSQNISVLKLKPNEIEALFLKQNLQLIAEEMNISIADAEISQAKLWDNPTLSVSGVNLWSTSKQREGESQVIPPLFGSFARNTQFSIELSQLIQTANKRGKLIAREKIAKDIAIQEFEIVLQALKIELRKTISEIIYLQSYRDILFSQKRLLTQLIESYKKQVLYGNISKAELLRLQSSLLEIENENNEILSELNEQLKNIKSYLAINPLIEIEIDEPDIEPVNPNTIALSELLSKVSIERSDIKLGKLQSQYFKKSLIYEKSQRVPDVTISANYDRSGGVWKDFIGFGISIDLPISNRNQGSIKAAHISLKQNQIREEQQINQAQLEVVEAYNNYIRAFDFYQKISRDALLSELDDMQNIYSKNLLNKNISMLEYVDFVDAYRSNKQTILAARKKIKIQFDELQYIVGSDIIENL